MPSVYSEPMEILNPPFQELETDGFPGAVAGQIEDPKNANPIINGEWLSLFASGTVGKLARAVATDPEPYLYYMDHGSTDVQTLKKGPILIERPRRIKTKIVSGASALAVGDEVMVGNVTYDGLTRAGFIKATGSGNYVQGRVLVAGTNSGNPDGSYWTIMLYGTPRKI